MNESNTLRELSSTLSEKERRELLENIRKSLNMEEEEDTVYSSQMQPKEREKIMLNEIEHESLWTRFVMWLKRLFSGKENKDIYIDIRLNRIKRHIKRKDMDLTGFETRDLKPEFAEKIFSLYREIYSISPVFQKIWNNTNFFVNAVTYLLESKLSDVKKSIEEFISIEEMEQIFEKTEKKEAIRDELLCRVKQYIDSIPKETVAEIESGMLYLYYIKHLIFFPYAKFFNLFGYTLPENLPEENPNFKSANAMMSLEYLEKLYYALYVISKIEKGMDVQEELLYFLFTGSENEEKSPEEIKADINNFRTELKNLMNHAMKIYKHSPLPELIKYFKGDPYYKLILYIPTLDLLQFYNSAMKLRFLSQVEDKMYYVRMNVINKKVRKVFKNIELESLSYYGGNPGFDYAKLDLPFFSHIRSLTLLYNFIRWYYKENMRELIHIVGRVILAHNRVHQNRLLHYASTVEDLEDKIQAFDYTLSPDADDGKSMKRFKFSIAKDETQQKLFRNMVYQKDREARALIERGIESLHNLADVIHSLRESDLESVKNQLQKLVYKKMDNRSFSDVMQEQEKTIRDFSSILNQIVSTERGGR